jgi:hypothetical protein
MDIFPLKAALSDLERDMETARDAKYQIECEEAHGRSTGGWEEPAAVLPLFLTNVYETLLVVLEAAGLAQTRERLVETWGTFENDGGIGKTRFDEQYDYLESRPFDYMEKLVKNVRLLASEGLDTRDAYELAMLENFLRKTPVLLRKRKVVPTSEKEIREIMHDYLGALFTQYKPEITITGILKDFKPDGGVRNLKAGIEFKFAATHEEVTRAMGGIFEDVSGYSGSLDWIRFYTVIYQTEAFESEDRIKSELARAGTVMTWKALLVTGAGTRRK